MNRNIVTGIDIGTHSVRILVAEQVKGEKTPRILSLKYKESRGLRHGYIVNFDEVVESLRGTIEEAEKSSGIRIKRAYVAVGGVSLGSSVAEGSVAVSRGDSEVSDHDVRRAVAASEINLADAANRAVIHTIPISFKLDGKKVMGRPVGMRGSKLEVKTLFITCLNQHLNDLVNAVGEAGLSVEDVLASPIAASFATLNKLQKVAGCVLADIGAETVSIVIFEEGAPVSLQVFPIGSTDITNDIALGLRISLEEAEEVKRGQNSNHSAPKRDSIIEARLSDIFELIEGHLKKIGRAGLLPAGIIIIGGGAKLNMIEEYAKSSLKLPAKVVPISFKTSLKHQVVDTSWAVAYGLCLVGLYNLEGEETMGIRLVQKTKNHFLRWLEQFVP